jgi:hypothetical protein
MVSDDAPPEPSLSPEKMMALALEELIRDLDRRRVRLAALDKALLAQRDELVARLPKVNSCG